MNAGATFLERVSPGSYANYDSMIGTAELFNGLPRTREFSRLSKPQCLTDLALGHNVGGTVYKCV